MQETQKIRENVEIYRIFRANIFHFDQIRPDIVMNSDDFVVSRKNAVTFIQRLKENDGEQRPPFSRKTCTSIEIYYQSQTLF